MSYRRVLLKLSGEALMGEGAYGVDHKALAKTAKKIAELSKIGVQIAIVCGGGNIFRGIQGGEALGFERTRADQMGLLATLINGIALQEGLEKAGCTVRMMSAIDCPMVAERFVWSRAMEHLEKGRILLFVGGTGHPYFTTDTCAALRASEIHADLLLKATMHVDGVYDQDPRKDAGAKKYDTLTYTEVVEQKLGVIDLTAATLCMTSEIPIRVYNFDKASLLDAVSDKPIGTLIAGKTI